MPQILLETGWLEMGFCWYKQLFKLLTHVCPHSSYSDDKQQTFSSQTKQFGKRKSFSKMINTHFNRQHIVIEIGVKSQPIYSNKFHIKIPDKCLNALLCQARRYMFYMRHRKCENFSFLPAYPLILRAHHSIDSMSTKSTQVVMKQKWGGRQKTNKRHLIYALCTHIVSNV